MAHLIAGGLLGDFRLIERVAAGGMGEIWRAEQIATKEAVAVKTMLGEAGRDRFEQEGEIVERLRHPGIVRHYANGRTEDGDPFLAMEWLEGRDLAHRLADGPLSVDEALDLSERVADALAYAHGNGVTHRDIKPSNIFLVDGDCSRPKLIDFGIARRGNVSLTATGAVIGTPAYMAPEQALGEQTDPRTDVYVLGCVLFECLAGRPAFMGSHPLGVLGRIVFEGPPRLADHMPGAPAWLELLIATAMAREPSARPSAGDEMARELRARRRAVTPRPADRPIMEREASFVALVLIARPAELGGGDTLELMPEKSVRAEAKSEQQTYHFADGTVVTVFRSSQSPKDSLVRAAHFALETKAAWLPEAKIAILLARSESEAQTSFGPAIDRGAKLLVDVHAGTIALGPGIASLLEGFNVREGENGDQLIGVSLQDPRHAGSLPFGGRSRELGLLLGAYEQVKEERAPQIAFVVGAAGIGKSRLVAEACARFNSPPPSLVWLGRAMPGSRSIPFSLLRQLLKSFSSHASPDALLGIDSILERAADASEVDEIFGARGWRAELGREWLVAMRRLLEHGAVVIWLDDLQDADPETISLFRDAVSECGRAPLLVVGTARSSGVIERLHLVHDRALVLELGPLSERVLTRMVELARPASDPHEHADLVSASLGFPFLLDQLTRSREINSGKSSDSLLAVLQGRTAVLSAGARRVLGAGAVFGERFQADGVAFVLQEPDLRLHFQELVREAWLVQGDATELIFRHALLRDAAYDLLVSEDRASAHRLAAEWLIARPDTEPAELAIHLEAAGRGVEAAQAWLDAAKRAMRFAAYPVAAEHAQRGLLVAEPSGVRVALQTMIAQSLLASGESTRAAEMARTALVEATPGSVSYFEATDVWAYATSAAGAVSDLVENRKLVDIVPLADAVEAGALSVIGYGRRLQQLGATKEVEALMRIHAASLDRAERSGGRVRAIRLRLTAQVMSADGRLDSALAASADAVQHLRELSDVSALIDALLTLSNTCCLAGFGDRGLVAADEARELATTHHLKTQEAIAWVLLAFAYNVKESGEEGLHAAQVAMSIGLASLPIRVGCHTYLARSFLGCGRPADALRVSRAGLLEAGALDWLAICPLSVVIDALVAERQVEDAARLATTEGRRLREGRFDEGEEALNLACAQAFLAAGQPEDADEALRFGLERLAERAGRITDLTVRRSLVFDAPSSRMLVRLARQRGLALPNLQIAPD